MCAVSSPTESVYMEWCFGKPVVNALTTSYNEQIRPLLAAIDTLHQLNVIQDNEMIKLRPIVFIGDRWFGKSSVIESLTGVRIPLASHAICTRVPILVRLQDDLSLPAPRLHLEYEGKRIEVCEADITEAIEMATSEIAGPGKCVSDTPLTVVVRNKGLPDLTLVDLPGIIVNPFYGQPKNIYEQVSRIILKYIEPAAESIIVNVISANANLLLCESIRLSKQVDRSGERTLAVITKVDMAPEGLLEKVTSDDVRIGLGYVCVRNRIGLESFDEARALEAGLFESHHLLSRIHHTMAGTPVLAQRLMKIQAQSIAKCLPADIMKKINDILLSLYASEKHRMPPQNRAFMQIISQVKESLNKQLLITGQDQFEENYYYSNKETKIMLKSTVTTSCPFKEMMDKYAEDMLAYIPSKGGDAFLMEEIEVLELELKEAFITLLRRKLEDVSTIPHDFVSKVWSYVEEVVLRVLREAAARNYPHLQVYIQITVHNCIDKMRKKSQEFVKEHIAMEMMDQYTYNPYYTKTWKELMHHQEEFMRAVCKHCSEPTKKMSIGLVGEVEVSHLRGKYAEGLIKQAFNLRMMLISYWKCVALRLVDVFALHVRHAVNNLVDRELESEIVKAEVVQGSGNVIEKMLDKSSCSMIAGKRENLRKKIQMLQESKDVLGKKIIAVQD